MKTLIVIMAAMMPIAAIYCTLPHNTENIAFTGGKKGDKHKKDKKKCPPKRHHHQNHGAHLSVIIDTNDPIIQNSDDDPGWVLIQAAREQKLNVEIDDSNPIEGASNLREEEVIIPTDVCLEDYIDGLKRIRFVKDVKVLPKEEGDEDE